MSGADSPYSSLSTPASPIGGDSVVILVPVLRRPHRVVPLLDSIEANTPQPHRVLFVTTEGDEAEQRAIEAAGAEQIQIGPRRPGDYARKINAGYEATSEPLLFLGADDLAFHAHWLNRAISRLGGPVQVVGTNDLGNPRVLAGYHATHSLVSRSYCDKRGTIDERHKVLHEGYDHEWVDSEFVETAMARQAWAFARDSMVEHLHPHWGKAPTDALYDAHAERMRSGRRIYLQRRHLWA